MTCRTNERKVHQTVNILSYVIHVVVTYKYLGHYIADCEKAERESPGFLCDVS